MNKNTLKNIFLILVLFFVISIPNTVFAYTNGYFDNHVMNSDYTIKNSTNYSVYTVYPSLFDNDVNTVANVSATYPIEITFVIPKVFEYIDIDIDSTVNTIYITDENNIITSYQIGTGRTRIDSFDSKFLTTKIKTVKLPGGSSWNEFDMFEPITPPSILSVSPANGRTDVAINDYVLIRDGFVINFKFQELIGGKSKLV